MDVGLGRKNLQKTRGSHMNDNDNDREPDGFLICDGEKMAYWLAPVVKDDGDEECP